MAVKFIALLLCTFALTGALANKNTWVSNNCDKAVVATTSYSDFGGLASSGFVNRGIPAYGQDHDTYYGPLAGYSDAYVRVEVWNSGASDTGHKIDVVPDGSVLAVTSTKAGCCDWYRAKPGHTWVDDGSGIWATTC